MVDVQSKLQALLETISEGADTEARADLVTDQAITAMAPRIGTGRHAGPPGRRRPAGTGGTGPPRRTPPGARTAP